MEEKNTERSQLPLRCANLLRRNAITNRVCPCAVSLLLSKHSSTAVRTVQDARDKKRTRGTTSRRFKETSSSTTPSRDTFLRKNRTRDQRRSVSMRSLVCRTEGNIVLFERLGPIKISRVFREYVKSGKIAFCLISM